MATTKGASIPAQSLAYILICVGGLVAFTLIGIWPQHKATERLKQRIIATESRIREQQILSPLFAQLLRDSKANNNAWFNVKRENLPRGRIEQVFNMLDGLSRESGLTLVSVTPDFQALDEDKGIFPVTVVTSGEFAKLQDYLTELFKFPHLRHIEQFQINEAGKECLIRLWLRISGESEKDVQS